MSRYIPNNECSCGVVWFAGKYFDEISQDTGKYCFGVEDTLKALEMGAVEILIVWENLETMRYVLKNHQTDGERSWLSDTGFITFWLYQLLMSL